MPFGYLEFSCAIRGNHAPARAAAGGGGRLASVPVQVRVPYLLRFFLNRVSRVWVTADHTRSVIRIRTAPHNGCQPTAADSWAVAAIETKIPLPERYL